MTVAAIFVCSRLDDPTRRIIPGSSERPCDACGGVIAVSPATLARSEAEHPGSRFLCVECARESVDGIELHPPTGAQVAEFEAAGYDPGSWPLRDHWGQKLLIKP